MTDIGGSCVRVCQIIRRGEITFKIKDVGKILGGVDYLFNVIDFI